MGPCALDCVDNQCAERGCAADDMKPTTCGIAASDYDQTCATDADCVPVYEGTACDPQCLCANAAINAGALDTYQSDLAKTVQSPNVCACAAPLPPRCVHSICTP